MTFEEWWTYQERVPYWRNVEKRQARDVWRVAIEEAAKVCEKTALSAYAVEPGFQQREWNRQEMAAAIRALKPGES